MRLRTGWGVFTTALVLRLAAGCTGDDPRPLDGRPDPGDASSLDANPSGSDGGAEASIEYPGDPGGLEALIEPGQTLKPLWDTTTFGVKRFAGWYDTKNRKRCAFRRDVDGNYRCFPITTAVAEGLLFASDTCTSPVARASCGVDPSDDFALSYDVLDECRARARTRLHKRVTTERTPHFERKALGCQVAAEIRNAGEYELGMIEKVDSFVKAEVHPRAVDGGTSAVVPHEIVAADGARQPFVLRTPAGGDCSVTETRTGLRCLPADPPRVPKANADFHAAPGCAVGGADVFTYLIEATCEGAPYALFTADSCASLDSEYRLVEAPVTNVYSGTGASCQTLTGRFRKVSRTATPITDFPSIRRVPEIPGIRLQPRRYELPDGTRGEIRDRYFDSAFASECRFDTAADGKVRCLPDAVPGATTFYEDDACAGPTITAVKWDASCRIEPPKYVTLAFNDDDAAVDFCRPGKKRVYELVKTDKPLFERKGLGNCGPINTVFGVVSDEIAPERFVELTPAANP